jgi:hypothetical protein
LAFLWEIAHRENIAPGGGEGVKMPKSQIAKKILKMPKDNSTN